MPALKAAMSAMTRRACQPEPEVAAAVASASSPQAVTSSIAAPAIVNAPTGRFNIRCSVRIRARTGKAVIDIATAMNRANGV